MGKVTVAGIEDTGVVDVVAHDPNTGEYMLVMVERRAWTDEPQQAQQLREKINTYVGFVLDGDMERTYPETAGGRVRLQLDCSSPPTNQIEGIIDHANRVLQQYGMRLLVRVND